MLLVDLPEEKINSFSDELSELGVDYNVTHDIWFMPVVQNIEHFKYWRIFNKNYVATEVFPRELGRKLVKAEEIRHESDYDTFYIASKEVTVEQIETAVQLIELVEGYCKTKQETAEQK